MAVSAQPDNKTRRYDRQLRLWAASGQNALESSRILVISATATTTSILKNLVLPGVGHFTILDPGTVAPEDAGNNFFFEGLNSVGKSRADEAVRLLCELNDSVEGKANTSSLENYLINDPAYLLSFTLIITHNISSTLLSKLSALLWSHTTSPSLIVVRSAGFLAEFFIQFHVHTIIGSHSETTASLRIDKPFPALLEHAMSLDFDALDITEHSHIPYLVILVHATENWKKAHAGALPTTSAEKQRFKDILASMKRKADEENFDEAVTQAYRAWIPTNVPSDIKALFTDANTAPSQETSIDNKIFFCLLDALQRFTQRTPNLLPLSAALPDMKSDTASYVHLQTLYKRQAEKERAEFTEMIPKDIDIDPEVIDEFVRNAHGLRVFRGVQFGKLDTDKEALSTALRAETPATATHIALSALGEVYHSEPTSVTLDKLSSYAHTLLRGIELDEIETEALDNALGEIARAPTADLPNTAAFLGGLVAQEAIKMITRQYVPVVGYCVVDLIESWTGVVTG